ncbi:hypothetical protein [Rhizohabitans arisaemae]|uniref:hypothetical protein n=1 Tax=Rhizohabitans arisaemae TaxID=2720610 RepID=UPI0024B261A2|nr:hypothetical protein [Rhizohabitans arisaemae]
MGVHEALAAVLTCPASLTALREDPERLRREHDLTEAELAMLVGAPHVGYTTTAARVRSKLGRLVGGLLPATTAALRESDPALWETFLTGTVRQAREGERIIGLEDAELLVNLLAERAAPPLASYARFELARRRLLHDGAAAGAARAWAASPEPADAAALRDVPVAVSAAARVAVLDHDVTSGEPPHRIPAARTPMLLHRRWGEPPLAAYRVGDGTLALLARCNGRHSGRQVAESMGGDRRAAEDALSRLAARGILHAVRR